MWIFFGYNFLCPILISCIHILVLNKRTINTNLSEVANNDLDFLEAQHSAKLAMLKLEKEKLNQFRELMGDELIKDYEKTDDFLIRWLQECNMDLNCSQERLRLALKWREENEMDTILNKTITTLKIPLCFFAGYDKIGGRVFIQRMGGLDLRKLISNGIRNKLVSLANQCIEKGFQASVRQHKNGTVNLNPGINIIDYSGSSLKQHGCLRCIEFLRQIAYNVEQFYPRAEKLIVLINVPKVLLPPVKLMRSFLNPYTKATIQIFGTDRTEWVEFLRSLISETELPVEYGGTKSLPNIMQLNSSQIVLRI